MESLPLQHESWRALRYFVTFLIVSIMYSSGSQLEVILSQSGHLAISRDIFGCPKPKGRGRLSQPRGEWNATNYPTMHRTAPLPPATKNYPTQNVNGAEEDKPWFSFCFS